MLTHLAPLLAALHTGDATYLQRPATNGARRGATFVEYLILAAIAALLFIVIYRFLGNTIADVFGRITNSLSGGG